METGAEEIMCGLRLRWELLQFGLLRFRSTLLSLIEDQRGQDMIEYALLAASVATIAIVIAGFVPSSIMPSISTIYSRITSTMAVS